MSTEATTQPSSPSLFDWAGGLPAFERLTDVFYEKVQKDEMLAPLFARMSKEHARHVAAFIAEVMGGPPVYSQPHSGHGHSDMVQGHFGLEITEAQRRRWMELIQDSADEAGLPDDPEFRSAFLGYLEWGSRLAVINSQPGAVAPPPDSPMPVWSWGAVGGPYVPPTAPTAD